MENVPDIIGTNNIMHFAEWVKVLDKMGYTSKWEVLNAKDFGIPQNRERCFMVSWLGDYYYDFPQPIKLTKRLKDMLESNVDEKFYLSDGTIDCFTKHTQECIEKGNGFRFTPTEGDGVGRAITTRAGGRMDDNFIKCEQVGTLTGEKWEKMHDISRRVYGENGLSPTLHTCGGGNLEPKIAEPIIWDGFNQNVRADQSCIGTLTRNCGADLKRNGQGIIEPIAYDEQNQYLRQDGCIGTLTTDGSSPKHNNRIVEPNLKTKMCNELIASGAVKENDVIRHSYTNSRMNGEMKDIQQNNISPTLDTRCDCLGVVNNYRIRKLTPRECFRLMGVHDDDFERVAKHQSNSSLYHLAGDSIVTNVLMAIIAQMSDVTNALMAIFKQME